MKANEQLFIEKIIDIFKDDFKGMTSDDKTLIIRLRNKTIEVDDHKNIEFDELINVIKEKIKDEDN